MPGHPIPLNALRAFEAAARHLSFKKAAQELFVTPAAISHQIKLVESSLGVTLFHRLTRAITLTSAGNVLLPRLSDGFARIAQAVEQVRAYENDATLTVNAPPSFAAKWLMPRLQRFISSHPEIDIRIIASMRFVESHPHDAALHLTGRDTGPLDADIDIRFGNGNYPQCRADLLFRLSVTPLCSPKLIDGIRPLRKPSDLRHHLLLHDDTQFGRDNRPDWVQWLKNVGADEVDPSRGLHFNHTMLGLEAAIDGLGVVLSSKELAARDVDAGRLVAPFDYSMVLPDSYYLVSAENAAIRPKIAAFRNWLLEEAGSTAK